MSTLASRKANRKRNKRRRIAKNRVKYLTKGGNRVIRKRMAEAAKIEGRLQPKADKKDEL